MDNETIDLAARLGTKDVAEVRSLNDKARRLALKIRDKLPTGGKYPLVSGNEDTVGIVVLNEMTCLSIFAPRVLEILHGEAMNKVEVIPDPMWVLGSRELQRVLAPAARVDVHTIAVEFEGETFHVEAWDVGDDMFEAIDLFESYGAQFECLCDLLG